MTKEGILRAGADGSLVGIISEPDESVSGRPTFLFLNPGLVHRIGPNRLHVNLARELGDAGFSAVRFDVSGLGDSGVRKDGLPYRESRILETQEVMSQLEEQRQMTHFVSFGICSGADHAFRVAVADHRVVGALMVDGYAYPSASYYFGYYAKRALRPRSWWNVVSGKHHVWRGIGDRLRSLLGASSVQPPVERFLIDLPAKEVAEKKVVELQQRGVSLFFLYTRSVHLAEPRRRIPAQENGDQIRVDHWPHTDHTFTELAHQQELISAVCDWARARWPGTAAGASAGEGRDRDSHPARGAAARSDAGDNPHARHDAIRTP